MGFESIEASDGLRAWQVLEDNPDVELVVSDVMMPNLDGRQLVRRVRDEDRLAGLPVILISDFIRTSEVSSLLDDGATAFLPKPLNPELFRAEVSRTRSGHHARSQKGSGITLPEQIIDRDGTLARLEGDHELLGELAETLLEDHDLLFAELVDAVESCDADTIYRAAHAYKGALSTFEAPELRKACLRLEELGREGRLDEVEGAMNDLRVITDRFLGELKQIGSAD